MDINKSNFDKDIFLNYINNNKLRTEDVAYLMKLYRIYILVSELKKEHSDKNENFLSQYEDKIYTVDGKIIPEIKRIELEISKINKKLLDKKTDISNVDKLKKEINEIKNLLKDLSLVDKFLLEYIKKKISVMQAMLGLNNTFLEATYMAFLEEYRNINISINSINEEKDDDYELDFMKKLKIFNNTNDNMFKGK